MSEVAEKVAGVNPRIAVFDRKRKIELALKLQQRWQRWELTNFDYLMQVCPPFKTLGVWRRIRAIAKLLSECSR